MEVGRLRGVALCCGIFDIAGIDDSGPFRNVLNAVGWAYSGTRDYRANSSFSSTISVPERVTDRFPPTFVTAGNADPLLPQSLALAATLTAKGVEVETLFYDKDHQPALGHEYQFDLGLAHGRAAFDRLIASFRRCTDGATRGPVGE